MIFDRAKYGSGSFEEQGWRSNSNAFVSIFANEKGGSWKEDEKAGMEGVTAMLKL